MGGATAEESLEHACSSAAVGGKTLIVMVGSGPCYFLSQSIEAVTVAPPTITTNIS